MVLLANAAVLVEHAGEDLLEEVKVLGARAEEPGADGLVQVFVVVWETGHIGNARERRAQGR